MPLNLRRIAARFLAKRCCFGFLLVLADPAFPFGDVYRPIGRFAVKNRTISAIFSGSEGGRSRSASVNSSTYGIVLLAQINDHCAVLDCRGAFTGQPCAHCN